MSDTNSNAYRQEATEKRVQITRLAAEANDLELKADELDGKVRPVETKEPEEDTPKNKLFGNK